MTTNNIENVKKSKAMKTREDIRAILTGDELLYLVDDRPYDCGKEYMIKLKTKKALNQDLPLLSQTRPQFLHVLTTHPTYHIDEDIYDEPKTTQIFEKRLSECLLQLYWLYEDELADNRKRAKVKSGISEKRIMKRINAKLKESKTYVHQKVEYLRQNHP